MTIGRIYAAVKRLPWRLWAILSALWIGFWLAVFHLAGISVSADVLYWMIVLGPPAALPPATVLVAAVLR